MDVASIAPILAAIAGFSAFAIHLLQRDRDDAGAEMQRMRDAMGGMAMLMQEREEDWARDREEITRLRQEVRTLEGEVARLTRLLHGADGAER